MPRGSNNRVDEQNTNRNNNNRLFDSQNNNKGGYSVGVDEDDYDNGVRERFPSWLPSTTTITDALLLFSFRQELTMRLFVARSTGHGGSAAGADA